MGTTTATSVPGAFPAPGTLTPVHASTYTTTAGRNLHPFNLGSFQWDGTSNLLVELCFDNNGYSTNDLVATEDTSYPASYAQELDGTNGCALTGGLPHAPSNERPVTYFVQEGDRAYTLPARPGQPGQVLTQQASGAVAFATPPWLQSGSAVYLSAFGARVGIGTSTPTQKLDVNGSAVVSGTLQLGRADGDKICYTDQGAAGPKLGLGTNWGVLAYAGPGTALVTGYHAWLTTATSGYVERMRLNVTGLGIGTTTPRGTLDVAGPGNTYLVNDPNVGVPDQSVFLPGHLYLAPYGGTSGTAYLQARVPNPATTTNIGLTLRTTSNGNLVNALRLNADGSANFQGTVTAAGVTLTSDARFKQQVRPLTGALAAVQQLRGVRYQWNALGVQRGGTAGQEQIGLLAQELEQFYPELVRTDEAGYKSVNYARLTPVLLEALKELAAKNAGLETRNNALETQVQQQQASLGSFEQRLRALEAGGAQARTGK
ncbi:tail fiber domain-containing protein [Hymenobacter ruricola]|uniref:Tail fiber domain-containing protein n=1 Tax=Hymenobacter ruricola TaxID=2791023 RepID=A0ABS0I158_9BACT|nr:tail fiber domain-containing protein [Hymenobacter ruricola]MBF9220536.1 tail fiber domain-containing protein [Hymenobacter ruricola]